MFMVKIGIVALTIFLIVYGRIQNDNLRDKRFKKQKWKSLKKPGYIFLLCGFVLFGLHCLDYVISLNIEKENTQLRNDVGEMKKTVIDLSAQNSAKLYVMKNETKWVEDVNGRLGIKTCVYNKGCRTAEVKDFRVYLLDYKTDEDTLLMRISGYEAFPNKTIVNKRLDVDKCCTVLGYGEHWEREDYGIKKELVLRLETVYEDAITGKLDSVSDQFSYIGNGDILDPGLPPELVKKTGLASATDLENSSILFRKN